MSTSVNSVTNHFPSAENGFSTTTSASVSSGATTVELSSVAGYEDGEVVVFVIDPTDAVKKQTFTGVVDFANTQITSVVWTAGTNQDHNLGATVADYATATHISMISKGLMVEHNQDGTHGDITATSIQVSGNITVGGNPLLPSGSIITYAGTAAPSGWLLCYGQAISRATYSDLFSALGTTYGVGDGSSTFNLPDLRGRVIAGKDDMGGSSANRLTNQTGGLNGDTLGATGGTETHTLTSAQMPSHTHTGTTSSNGNHNHTYYRWSALIQNAVAATDAARYIVQGENLNNTGDSGSHTHTFTTASSGSNGAHNNVQPTIILNYIIKT